MRTACLSVAVAIGAALSSVQAQRAPVERLPPAGSRYVHPSIAPQTQDGATLNGSAPLFAYADGRWNHGEGFSVGADADTGGWFGHDDGTGVTAADVHTPFGWQSWRWLDPTHVLGQEPGSRMLRLYGYLRPAGVTRESTHPLYGPLASNDGPFLDGTYVDQAAFELFRSIRPPRSDDKIVICISTRATTRFPRNYKDESYSWRHVYPGIFSPDGLVRREPRSPQRSRDNFLGNLDDDDVVRPAPLIVATGARQVAYYPIFGYVVPTVMHRQTELNEQRDLQLVQAIKAILMEDPALGRNPLRAALSAAGVSKRVYVVFHGSSNGGLQAMWAALRHPEIVHGNLSNAMSASKQRLIGELDMKHAIDRLSGAGEGGSETSENDLLQWGQYAWNQQRWIHDLSMVQRQLRGQRVRPACFVVGDEDITATGTDWIRVMQGKRWQSSGAVLGVGAAGDPAANRFTWAAAENGCHGQGRYTNPYTGRTTFHAFDALHGLILDVIAQKDALGDVDLEEIGSQPRTIDQALRGPDDPHEWVLGRLGQKMTTGDGLSRDDAWFQATQPGAAGTMLGYKESMLIRDRALFVGSAEGVVSKFVVDPATEGLVKVAHSNPGDASSALPLGTPLSLGHEAFAMTSVKSLAGLHLVVATRRHLHQLEPKHLTVIRSQQIPWEIARPRHLQVADVLPDDVHRGPEVMFCSQNGGLAFYDLNLKPVFEWPEPGIVDFTVRGSVVSILSQRGVVANVRFVAERGKAVARLLAASKPLPTNYNTEFCQGDPRDLEQLVVDGTGYGAGVTTELVSAWISDGDHGAVRGLIGDGLFLYPHSTQLGIVDDVAATRQPLGYGGSELEDGRGQHLLVLSGTVLRLFDQLGQPIGVKHLNRRQPASSEGGLIQDYPFGNHAHAIAVGELVANQDGYSDEVVVAGSSGGLIWMHVQEVAAETAQRVPGTFPVESVHPLPSPQFDLVPGSAQQPRTNRSLSATWGVARRAMDDDLHLLDQRGVYWRAGASGDVSFETSSNIAVHAKGWSEVGNRDELGTSIPFVKGGGFDPSPLNNENLTVLALGQLNIVTTRPWAPIDSGPILFEASPQWLGGNWFRDTVSVGLFAGFAVHQGSGTIVNRPSLGAGVREIWHWSGRGDVRATSGDWGNVVQAYRLDLATDEVVGTWASTGEYSVKTEKCEHHDMRSFTTQLDAMNQQSMRVFELASGEVVVVLGCPGGRVRVLRPGTMRVDETQYHELGSMQSSEDLGFGGSGLAVRQEPSGDLSIWFGTITEPCARPLDTGATGSLDDDAVAAGAVHRMSWSPTTGLGPVAATKVLLPNQEGLPRGGYGVVGITVANILGPASSPPEVIVGTVGGEILILDEDLKTVQWRANVPGSAGFYNSIRVEDLDQSGRPELYVCGSYGLWRFTP